MNIYDIVLVVGKYAKQSDTWRVGITDSRTNVPSDHHGALFHKESADAEEAKQVATNLRKKLGCQRADKDVADDGTQVYAYYVIRRV